MRGHAPEHPFRKAKPVVIQAWANGAPVGEWTLDRNGLFMVEADLPEADEYRIEIAASPEWKGQNDERASDGNAQHAAACASGRQRYFLMPSASTSRSYSNQSTPSSEENSRSRFVAKKCSLR